MSMIIDAQLLNLLIPTAAKLNCLLQEALGALERTAGQGEVQSQGLAAFELAGDREDLRRPGMR